MSGTISLPDSISVEQNDVGPSVTLIPAGGGLSIPGVPPYPLASDPAQTWSLQDVNGVLTWVQYALSPLQGACALEDGDGVDLLEDGGGVCLLEIE